LNQNAYSYDVGGEFSAVTSPSFLANYNSSAIVNGGFETFCVETTVDFSPGHGYTFTLSNQDSLGRDLTLGAAFLYYEFGTGNLSGYNYANASTRKADAGLLQAAIWWLQGNQTYNDGHYVTPTLVNNPFYALAVTTLGGAVTDPNNGTYGVEVLQLWDERQRAAQNQLVITSVPDGGMTAGFLGLGLASLAFIRTKLRPA